ncbi:pentatricopeptide repeat-containing protein At4g21065-like [Phoenix dactylifera]|uniref:Pentatricopeptide repeat-containing protein At4g21065-like n=1 Tax=Phoenix dactylifera TaxID=42345 RepID=A0A8B7MVY4_PHODC|nr:pentatricopeptide repeat-containing protein At4g21065-like [Phoenix dactylifera]XP_026664421.2 pentatricopeptide repeat-containing protein At4g21065-like [Phoenix dactylifera]XP_038988474.1 pentatricopeptide repeat-containing protein At4g21065-like [Phoenix dactylifera]
MLRGSITPKNLVIVLRATTSISRARLSSPAGDQTPPWISSNQIIQRHPRLLALETCDSPRQLQPILAYAIVSGLFRNPFVASRVLHSAVSSSPPPDLAFASLIFSQMEKPNLFSWNAIIRALAASEDRSPSAAFSVYAEMLQRGTLPDKYTFPFLLKACRSSRDLCLGRLGHAHALVLDFVADPFVQTAIVRMYLSCGCLGDAHKAFDGMPHRDVVAWTAMISGLIDQGCHWEALEVLNEMRFSGLDASPNVATMVSAMSACANVGSLVHAKGLHSYVEKVGLEGDVFIRNSLIDMYAKCGSIAHAVQVFHSMSERDLHSWTTLITGLASHGFGKEALDVFSQMQRMGVVPDATTFVVVLSACSHAGLAVEGLEIFDSMERVHGVVPELKHYGCMVDLLSRAGLLDRAYKLVSSMPIEPNLAILGALLSACRIHDNLEIAELVSKKIKSICRYKGGVHVLLSNMYANKQQWNEVASIREMTGRDASKPPGWSWIEVRGVIHEFLVEDRSHPHYEEMHLVLHGLGKLMEEFI